MNEPGSPASMCSVHRLRSIAMLVLTLVTACDGDVASTENAAPSVDMEAADTWDSDSGSASDAGPHDRGPSGDSGGVDQGLEAQLGVFDILVLLDGAPAADVLVVQGGTEVRGRTDANGRVRLTADMGVVGDIMVIANHPRARQRGEWLFDGIEQPVVLSLTSYGLDNPGYHFQDPGEPRRRNSTAQCGHCHLTINDAWFGSAHQRSANNPVVLDLYAGTAAALDDPVRCVENGGRWGPARIPGSDDPGEMCFVGVGVLPALNAECAEGPCIDPRAVGDCADCHAPAMNGQLGGRDLLDARALAFDYGISCDVCHRVDEVLDAGPPGVAGRLVLHRPSDPGPITLGAGGVLPLTFGPSHDSPNPRMGSVQRDHFLDGRICSGCHQYDAAPLADEVDQLRWPTGVLPIQSTWAEWQAGPLADVPCQSCHMPPEPGAANSADLQAFPAAQVGIQGGWFRPPGAVRRHRWTGPRAAETLATRAATVSVRFAHDGDRLEARVTVRNVGAGHAIPTGEALRQMLLTVDATCDARSLPAIGGDAVPSWGGAVATRGPGDDRAIWPDARPGDVIRVVHRAGDHHDYAGFGPFGDGTFDASAKGMPMEQVVGEAMVVAVDPAGLVELDRRLPEGHTAYLVRDDALAGASGFGFARVMVDAAGRLAPHFAAVDVRSDNRLMPGASWTSSHVFDAAGCEAPRVRARLLYRAWPWALGRQRGWTPREHVMAEEVR